MHDSANAGFTPSTDTAIIACAGRGSRLGHSIPKSCVEVGGKTLIQWQLEALSSMRQVVAVVGYRHNFVIDEILTHTRRITLVVNKEWADTNTAYSLSLACDLFEPEKRVLTIDGDTLFSARAVESMLRYDKAAGWTAPMSDEGVFIETDKNDRVTGFTREKNTGMEWTGMAIMPAGAYRDRPNCFVYQVIEKRLPVQAVSIDLVEIDTPDDLDRARQWIKGAME